MLRLVQHGVKSLLEGEGHGLGQLPVHHPAAQGQQHPNGTALQHRATHQLVSCLLIHREIVTGPGILRAVQTPRQQTAGVRVPVLHCLLKQTEALLSPAGG